MKKTNYRLTFLSCYLGYIVQAVVVNLSPLFFIVFQSDFGISYGNLANLVLICFFVQLFIDFASIKLCDIINYHTLAVIANLLAAAGLICLGTLPMVMNHYAGIVIAVIISSIGSGFIEVIISPIVDAIPADSGNSSMSMLHSFYCWGQVITVLFSTIALAIIGKDNWYFIPICWAIIPLVNAILFIKAPLPEFVKKEERTPIKKLFSSKTFIIFIIIMMCSGSSECTIAQWASLFAEKGLGVTKAVGDLLGPCLFAVLMGIGRTIFGKMGDGFNFKRALTVCAAACLACYAALVFVPSPVVGLAACALTGLCVSLMWPGTLTLGSQTFPKGGLAMFSVFALGGDLGCTIGPYLAGQISGAVVASEKVAGLSERFSLSPDQIGLRAGILAGAIFPIIMIIALVSLKNKKPAENK